MEDFIPLIILISFKYSILMESFYSNLEVMEMEILNSIIHVEYLLIREEESLLLIVTNHRIQVFNSRGEFLFKFESKGSEDGRFNSSCEYQGKEDGHLVVQYFEHIRMVGYFYYNRFEWKNIFHYYDKNQVQVFNSDGKFLFKFGSRGNGDSQFNIQEEYLLIREEESLLLIGSINIFK